MNIRLSSCLALGLLHAMQAAKLCIFSLKLADVPTHSLDHIYRVNYNMAHKVAS